MTAPAPGPGRPRDPRTDQAIMLATRRLLAEVGYDQVSIESIAREAGVGRPTIYRRWPSKAHVVFDAAFGSPAAIGDMLASSGDFDTDLRRFIAGVLDFWREPVVAAAALGILADRTRDPQLQIRTQQLLDEETRTQFGALVQSGVDQGAVRSDLDVDMLFDLLVGTSFYTAQVLLRDHNADEAIERLCLLVMQGAQPRDSPPNGDPA
jgi:AcrR family transcriptional regulator